MWAPDRQKFFHRGRDVPRPNETPKRGDLVSRWEGEGARGIEHHGSRIADPQTGWAIRDGNYGRRNRDISKSGLEVDLFGLRPHAQAALQAVATMEDDQQEDP